MNLPKAISSLTKWTDSTEARWSRLALDCVRLKRDSNTVFAEATDGRRLCRLTWFSAGADCDYKLPAKALGAALRTAGVTKDGYFAMLNGSVSVFGRKPGATVVPEETGRWPQSEEVLYPKEGKARVRWWPLPTRSLRDDARKALAEQKGGLAKPALDLEICGAKVRLDARYVRDMCDTAIQCGFDRVYATATDEQSAVHFSVLVINDIVDGSAGEPMFECVIMPLARD